MSARVGKVAVVTGASRGIGRAIALGLARASADVAGNDHMREDAARKTATQVAAVGRRSLVVPAGVFVTAEVTRLVLAVETAWAPATSSSTMRALPNRLPWTSSRRKPSTRRAPST